MQRTTTSLRIVATQGELNNLKEKIKCSTTKNLSLGSSKNKENFDKNRFNNILLSQQQKQPVSSIPAIASESQRSAVVTTPQAGSSYMHVQSNVTAVAGTAVDKNDTSSVGEQKIENSIQNQSTAPSSKAGIPEKYLNGLKRLETLFPPLQFEFYGAGVGDMVKREHICDFDIRIILKKESDANELSKWFLSAGAHRQNVLHLTDNGKKLFLEKCKELQLPYRTFPNFSYHPQLKQTDYLHAALSCGVSGKVIEDVPGALDAAINNELITIADDPNENYPDNPISLVRGAHRLSMHGYTCTKNLSAGLGPYAEYIRADNLNRTKITWHFLVNKLQEYSMAAPDNFWHVCVKEDILSSLLFNKNNQINFDDVSDSLYDIAATPLATDPYYILAFLWYFKTKDRWHSETLHLMKVITFDVPKFKFYVEAFEYYQATYQKYPHLHEYQDIILRSRNKRLALLPVTQLPGRDGLFSTAQSTTITSTYPESGTSANCR